MAQTITLERKRAQKFLELLAERPFVCLVHVDGDLRIFSKGMSDEELTEVRARLAEIEGDADGEDEDQG